MNQYSRCPHCYLNEFNQITASCDNCSFAKIQCRRLYPVSDTRMDFPRYGVHCHPLNQIESVKHLTDLWYWQNIRQTSSK